jgi:GIY-YIG catalytic domain-containing protein
MIDYQKGKIYMIVGKKINKIYIGSTTYTLAHRLEGHKDDYFKWLNGKPKYVSSYKIIEAGETLILLLENYPCETKKQLHERESYWIKKYRPICVNIQNPTKSKFRKRYNNYLPSTNNNFIETIQFLD